MATLYFTIILLVCTSKTTMAVALGDTSAVTQLEKRVRMLIEDNNKLSNEISSLDPYCLLLSETTCGPCRCRDNNKLKEKFYCDCQSLTPERDCRSFYEKGIKVNGVYKIHQNNLRIIQVFCDQTTDGGGWTVFQRRIDGSVNFYRDSKNYILGFGDLSHEFWLGNNNLFTLSHQALYPKGSELRIDVQDWNDVRKHAKYNSFQVGNHYTKYKLHVSGYSGTAGDSLLSHNGYPFSTFDWDNDSYENNCALKYKGGWWYERCHTSNLNGKYYYYGEMEGRGSGIHWHPFHGHGYSLKHVEMKMRRI